MRVLIVEFDLFGSVGGGQTVYRRLIQTNPAIQFYYFRHHEPRDRPRPANAVALPYRAPYSVSDYARRRGDLVPPRMIYEDLVAAKNFACSVAGMQFDVVELPDFRVCGYMLAPTLRHHGVQFGKIALSMHGRISTTISLNWGGGGGRIVGLENREELQFLAADLRYGLSRSYIEEWQQVCGVEAHYLHPMRFLEPPFPEFATPRRGKPSLLFVGRAEKRKGPDLFTELVWWLPRDLFAEALIVGPPSHDGSGTPSDTFLKQMFEHRTSAVELRPAMTPDQLQRAFAGRSVVFLPSRYDSFNLVALEALFAGCPTVIGSGAGVCRFLREEMPDVPFIEIDLTNTYGCLPAIRAVLEDYNGYRDRLVSALRAWTPRVAGPSLEDIYASESGADPDVCARIDGWYRQLARRTARRSLGSYGMRLARAVTPPGVRPRLKRLYQDFRNGRLREGLRLRLLSPLRRAGGAYAVHQAVKARNLVRRYKQIFQGAEDSEWDVRQKLEQCWHVAGETRLDRARVASEIARLERLRHHDLFAATYELRVMRLLGDDRLGLLPLAVRSLRQAGFPREAEAAKAMYGPVVQRDAQCRQLLDEALARLRENPQGGGSYEVLDDRRASQPVRASIIVSLYKAAPKLRFFLGALQNQTLLRQRQAELILIDSGSPDDQYRVFGQLMAESSFPVLYARTAQRETIQAAWNRGIELARGPYLCFLGADETILPDCLEHLAGILDAEPAVDWVIADSLVTQVDKRGNWANDIMAYDRQGYRQDLVYLETCYLSWVGGLYRKSIHERFGYYDPTFHAAGDTEFKGRVMPFIQSRHVPRTLGVFCNYPDDRTTQSPHAEIEDLRAWYLHRTPVGVAYAFQGRDAAQAEALFFDTLRYRKSFCRHWSTDLDYAQSLLAYLRGAAPQSPSLHCAEGVDRLVSAYRHLEWLPNMSTTAVAKALLATYRTADQINRRHASMPPGAPRPQCHIFNDNRHEQHTHIWRSGA